MIAKIRYIVTLFMVSTSWWLVLRSRRWWWVPSWAIFSRALGSSDFLFF